MQQRDTFVAVLLGTAAVAGVVLSLLTSGLRLTLVNWTLLTTVTAVSSSTIWWLARRAGRRDGVTLVLLVAACSAAATALLGPALQLVADLPAGVGFQEVAPAHQPAMAATLGVVGAWLWIPSAFTLSTFGLLLFPDGRLPSRRWRLAGMAAVGGMILIAVNEIVISWPTSTVAYAEADNTPFALGFPLTLLASLAGLASLVVRYRRSDGVVRHQIRWLAVGGVILLACLFLTPSEQGVGQAVATVGAAAFFTAYGVAVLKYRLFDVDIVINRTLVYGALAALITGVYVAVVVGVGSLVGRGDEPDLLLSILATAIVAVLFEPARHRLQRVANHVVYGERATPFEVLSNLTERLSTVRDRRETLQLIARLLRQGTGADAVVIWMHHTEGYTAEVVVSDGELSPEPVEAVDDLPGDVVERVRHDGESLGAISIHKAAGDVATAPDRQLVRDVARSAGLVMFNLRLDEQLEERATELRDSRRRLVAAQDTARRQLERDLHDGAQQQVVAVKVKLGIARTICEREGLDGHAARAEELAARTQQAVDLLRQVARGIYPPLLAGEGLPVALKSLAPLASTPVTFDLDPVPRQPEEVEATVYFSVLEALRNVDQHAGATSATVTLSQDGDRLAFAVVDDGRGFDASSSRGLGLQAVQDRLEALDGQLEVSSGPGGTTVAGFVVSEVVLLPEDGVTAEGADRQVAGR